jgi:hypothetical protein
MEIPLDGRGWRDEMDLIEAVIHGVQGPDWHGRNYNALRDSLVVGSINGIEPPYDFVITMPANPNLDVADAISYFVARITAWRAEGANLSVRLEPC